MVGSLLCFSSRCRVVALRLHLEVRPSSTPTTVATAAPAEPVAGPTPAPLAEPAPPANAHSETPLAAPEAPATPPASPSDTADLAGHLAKGSPQAMGYSPTQKAFVFPVQRLVDQVGRNGFVLDVQFVGEDGKSRYTLHVCSLRDCEEQAFDLGKNVRPKLAARLDKEGYMALEGVAWPSRAEEVTISSLGVKLRYANGSLSVVREGKPAVALTPLGGKRLGVAPHSVFPVPDSPLLAVIATLGDEREMYQGLYVFRIPAP